MVVNFENGLNTAEALRAFLKRLMEDGIAEAVLAACASPHSPLPMPTLVSDPALLARAVPLAPAAPVSGARMAARVLAGNAGRRIAVVLRPCEVRALIELAKLNQCTLEPAIVISMDCFGRLENDKYLERAGQTDDPEAAFSASAAWQAEICTSCRACVHFVPQNVDVAVCLAGRTGEPGITLAAGSPAGEEILKSLGAASKDMPAGREAEIERLLTDRQARRDAMILETADRMADMAAFQRTIATCLNCYNCRTACPVCYCKACVFDTDVFAHRPEILLGRAARKGAVKIPTDTTMFHLTRMAHMAHACVGCGQCSSVCPSGIPVADLFIGVARKVQDHYDYVPGQDPGRPWPIMVADEDQSED